MAGKRGMTKTVQDTNIVQVRDTFETPKYAIDLLLPFIPKHLSWIWECASGGGRIASVLDNSFIVYRTDIRGDNVITKVFNFVEQDIEIAYPLGSAIITNPPFSIKSQFIDKAFQYNVPFAFLINADYSGECIEWIRRGCEKIVPTKRINYLTPNILERVHEGEIWKLVSDKKYCKTLAEFKEKYFGGWISYWWKYNDLHNYKALEECPSELLYKYSSSQFHSMWLTYGFGLGRTETFVDVDLKYAKENMR